MNTPDQQINPPDDDRFATCYDCKGDGKIIDWTEFESETHDVDDDLPKITCPTCKGEGKVEKEEGGDEW